MVRFRGVKLKDGVINPPTGGWEASPLYIAVNPAAEEQVLWKISQSPLFGTIPKLAEKMVAPLLGDLKPASQNTNVMQEVLTLYKFGVRV